VTARGCTNGSLSCDDGVVSGVRSSRPERDLGAIRDGDSVAFVAHLDGWVDRMHDASQNIVGTTDAAATVCHEVVQSLWERRGDLTADDLSRESLLLATRQRSLEHLAAHGWHPPSTEHLAGLHHDSSATRYRVTLAHAAATVIGAGNVSLLDLHFRHGVDAAALDDALDVDAAAAPRRLAQLRSELDEAIAAYVLWSDARPGCPGLGEATDFDATVFATVSRHRSTCPECAREHRSLVNPAGLFLTAPTMTAAPALRQRVLSVTSDPDALWTATVAAPITATTIDGAHERIAAVPDIDELWASTVGATPAPRSAPVTPSRPPMRPRTATIVSGAAVLLAVFAGGVALAMRGSDSGDRIVVDRGSNSEQPPTDEEEPEVRSLAPVPPSTEGWTTQPKTTQPKTTEPALGELPERSEIIVVAANGANVAGAAGNIATWLEGIGYVDVLPVNGSDIVKFTTVYFADGFEDAALRMTEDLDLLPVFVAPAGDAPSVDSLPADVGLLVYIGRDRA